MMSILISIISLILWSAVGWIVAEAQNRADQMREMREDD